MFKRLNSVVYLFITALMFFPIPILGDNDNLIKNPGFEEIENGIPSHWYKDAYPPDSQDKIVIASETDPHSGQKSISLTNKIEGVANLIQDVPVQLGKVYKLSVWVKTENIDRNCPAAANMTLLNGIYETPNLYSTENKWERLEAYVRIRNKGSNTLNFCLRLGGFGAEAKGKVYYDDASMELVINPPADLKIEECFVPSDEKPQTPSTTPPPPSKFNIANYGWIIFGVILFGLFIFIEIRFVGKSEDGGVLENTEDIK